MKTDYIDPFGKNFKNFLSVKIRALGKPRMVRSDSWKKRPCVLAYWEYKKELLRQLPRNFIMPNHGYHLVFYFSPRRSYSLSKKEEMAGTPHQQKPDKDNLEKAFLDCVCKNDAYIYHGEVSKWWCKDGNNEIKLFW